jgi:ArsR family transcriptional regulator, virulence genes transcriptional regulator
MKANVPPHPMRARDARAMRRHSAQAARLLRALANEQRLLILCALAEGEATVAGLNTAVELSQSALSQHLAVLRTGGIVDTRREGQQIYYSLKAGPAKLVMQQLYDIYCRPR